MDFGDDCQVGLSAAETEAPGDVGPARRPAWVPLQCRWSCQRDGLSNFAAFGFPKRVGQGGSIVYLVTFLDDKGEPIAGERSYRLHVPPSVPAKQYCSVVAYDAVTYGFIRESPVVGLDSYNQAMQRNTDGSAFGRCLPGPKRPGGSPPDTPSTSRLL